MVPRGRRSGSGAGQGRGQGGRGPGCMGGSRKAEPIGNCVCPQCGLEMPRYRGAPYYRAASGFTGRQFSK
jgi:hypothetical protein